MQHMKEIATAVGTLAIAVGIGFVMQSSETAQERYGKSARPITIPAADPPQETLSGTASGDILLEVEEIELTSASDPAIVPVPNAEAQVQRASVSATDVPQAQDALPNPEQCEMTANATATSAAMVNLTLDAPCAANERLTVHHNGMMFTQTTDAAGGLTVTVPALTEQAVFILAFSTGEGAVAQTTVPDLGMYDRVALQWRGRAGFELHAREFGADYGQDGHVWTGAPQNAAGMARGQNGFAMRLGDALAAEPLVAEIYTFPTGAAQDTGIIDMSVEAEVTNNNCGLEIEAQSLEMMAGGTMKTQDLILSVPDCDAVGSFLVLNNLVSDLKVAGN
ncbi:hypothetical protein [uncultured Tateyamaria sp.]|uniref:hypothetical protein n=1 Tax=uncultured Tateyamaria sp. TaxID=455651 RepID=UPI00260D37B8|nr:hypothetical protein [uncultured Tateyamaria sp.]